MVHRIKTTHLRDFLISVNMGSDIYPPHVCFPWAVVQVHGIMTKEFSSAAVSCASTVASTALSMLERLAKFADEKHDGQHIPPVISITSNGSKTTVWLIYCEIVDEKLRDHVRPL
jgi:hypothetical protein